MNQKIFWRWNGFDETALISTPQTFLALPSAEILIIMQAMKAFELRNSVLLTFNKNIGWDSYKLSQIFSKIWFFHYHPPSINLNFILDFYNHKLFPIYLCSPHHTLQWVLFFKIHSLLLYKTIYSLFHFSTLSL